jgi:hypothetical protein
MFADYTDTVSDSGDYDCGPRKYTLTSNRDELIASVEETRRPLYKKIAVKTSSAAMYGNHVITMTVELENYPELTQYISF